LPERGDVNRSCSWNITSNEKRVDGIELLSGSPQPAVANAIAKTENTRSSNFIYGSPQ
jgi:hypothetical protein